MIIDARVSENMHRFFQGVPENLTEDKKDSDMAYKITSMKYLENKRQKSGRRSRTSRMYGGW